MGLLAENKTRRRINKDPNNTKWTRDETTFGQKILRAQGWQPGQFLGAQDAPHSELHTAANASYIRVVLKDDMKGLGFQRAKEDEVTGLGVFADLLSRLNGKSDAAIEEDQQARLAIKTHHFVEKRWGPMRFVRGGLLVGDELKEVSDDSSEEEEEEPAEPESKTVKKPESMEVDPAPKESKKEKKSKKRKAVDDEDSSDKESASKSKKRRREERKAKDSEDIDDAKARKKEKKAKKDKSRSADASDEEKIKDKKSKKEKKEKKEKKREKKEKRRREEAEASDSATQVSATPSVAGTGTSTPTGSGTGTSTPRGSRNFVRSRFIAQKRQAVLDTKALNQIFMVKA